MKYVSTRGRAPALGFREVLLAGLAPDGGLYVPQFMPPVGADELEAWRALSYAELATAVLARFAADVPVERLRALTHAVYTAANFGNGRADSDAAEITPLRWLAPGFGLLELSNGPTLAFKDLAMQILGALLEDTLALRGETLNILGATSGDTGSAAEHALRGRPGVQVFMLSPQGRMSAFQRAQMYALQDANIHNLALAGVFDDCQDVVKAIAGDTAFKARHRIGAVNSINWARVAAQVVYYFKGWLAATTAPGQRVSFCVPSGNFGNILAGWVARQMGLPVGRLLLASNENNVLDEFFRSGRYRVRGAAETHATSSPSMDISKASNFERYVYDLGGRDPDLVRELWWQLDTRGQFDLAGSPLWDRVQASGFASATSTHADRLHTIRTVLAEHGLLVDPHTADGIGVAWRLRAADETVVCLETALPVKFADTIVAATGRMPDCPPALAGIEAMPQRCVELPADAAAVRAYIAAHDAADARP